MPEIVGNLYVDQGWIFLQRGDVATADSCASRGRSWLGWSGDRIFASELAGQVALRRREFPKAIKTFESLCSRTQEGSRQWLVFSYRLADAARESGDLERGRAILQDLVQRIDTPATDEQIDDVRGRILYRAAVYGSDERTAVNAAALASRAVSMFESSGIIAPERRAAVMLWSSLLSEGGRLEESRRVLLAAQEQAQREGDFEMLTAIGQRLAVDGSAIAAVSGTPPPLPDL